MISTGGVQAFWKKLAQTIKLNWTDIHTIQNDTRLNHLLQSYPKVFTTQLGELKGTQAKIYIDSNAKPRFFRPRPLPLATREKAEKELVQLQ